MSTGLQLRLELTRPDFQMRVALALPADGISVIYGPSGSGKTTLLRCIAGLEPQSKGLIQWHDDTWLDSESGHCLPTHRRPVGYIFQEASLFEHLDVRRNIEYGMKRSRDKSAAAQMRRAIELLSLTHLLSRDVAALSGGERQRVAIARALATCPRLLLLDEPLTALDPAKRNEVMPWLLKLRQELRMPMVYVTHSVDELTRLGDHLVVMSQGQVQVSGPMAEVFVDLKAPWLPEQEQGALLSGLVAEMDPVWRLARIDLAGADLWVQDQGLALGQEVRVRLLARDISIGTQEPQHTSIQNHWPVRIINASELGHPSHRLIRLSHASGVILARITHRAWDQLQLKSDQQVWIQVKSVAVVR